MMRWIALAMAAAALGMVIAVQADQEALYNGPGGASGGLWEDKRSFGFLGVRGVVTTKTGDLPGDQGDTYKAAQAFGIITAVTILAGMIATAFFRSLRIAMMLHVAGAVFSFVLFVLCLVLFVHEWSVRNQTYRLSDHLDVNYGMFLALLSSILLGIAAFLCVRAGQTGGNEPIHA